jgi:hypothetical protein
VTSPMPEGAGVSTTKAPWQAKSLEWPAGLYNELELGGNSLESWVVIYWDILRYGSLSPFMIGYNIIY